MSHPGTCPWRVELRKITASCEHNRWRRDRGGAADRVFLEVHPPAGNACLHTRALWQGFVFSSLIPVIPGPQRLHPALGPSSAIPPTPSPYLLETCTSGCPCLLAASSELSTMITSMADGAGPCWAPAGSGLAQATLTLYPHPLQRDPCRIQC